MVRRTFFVLVVVVLFTAVMPTKKPLTRAQGEPDAVATYALNLRSGPGSTYTVIATLDAGQGVRLKARNADTAWVLAVTDDGTWRGWLASLYLTYRDGFTPTSLPLSEEIVIGLGVPAASADPVDVPEPAVAADELDATITTALNIRQGPGRGYPVIGQFAGNTPVVLEARSSLGDWVLARSGDGSLRGWVAAAYVAFAPDQGVGMLAESAEALAAHEAEPPVIQQLRQTPVVAVATGRAAAIYQAGLARGNHPDRFSKVGDCQNIPSFFLGVYDRGEYNLGSEYAYLQDTITRFSDSFGRESAAVWSGFNVYAVLDPTWADPSICRSGESPIECEYRIWQPSFVIISLEVWHGAPGLYLDNLRQVLDFWISKDVVPILATKADNREDDWSINVAIASLAWEYDIPLWNFFMAAQPLPNHGLQPDGFHLTYAQCNFESAAAMQNAWPWRNLTALQSLDLVRRGVGG